jgi:hypothetical protein
MDIRFFRTADSLQRTKGCFEIGGPGLLAFACSFTCFSPSGQRGGRPPQAKASKEIEVFSATGKGRECVEIARHHAPQQFPVYKEPKMLKHFCEFHTAKKVAYRRAVPARASRGPNAAFVERPRDRFERGCASLRIASMTGRRPDANWSSAAIWICRPHTPAAACSKGCPAWRHWLSLPLRPPSSVLRSGGVPSRPGPRRGAA